MLGFCHIPALHYMVVKVEIWRFPPQFPSFLLFAVTAPVSINLDLTGPIAATVHVNAPISPRIDLNAEVAGRVYITSDDSYTIYLTAPNSTYAYVRALNGSTITINTHEASLVIVDAPIVNTFTVTLDKNGNLYGERIVFRLLLWLILIFPVARNDWYLSSGVQSKILLILACFVQVTHIGDQVPCAWNINF